MFSFLLVSGFSTAHADWYRHRFAVGGWYGSIDPIAPQAFRNTYTNGRIFGGFGQYGLSRALSLVGSYGNVLVERGSDRADLEFQPYLLEIKIHPLFPNGPVVPYLKGGGGLSANRIEVPDGFDIRWTKFAARAALGLEVFLHRNFSLSVEGTYSYFQGVPDNPSYRLAGIAGIGTIYFGRPDRPEKAESAAASPAAAAASSTMAATAPLQQAQAELADVTSLVGQEIAPPVSFTGKRELDISSFNLLDRVAEVAQKYPQYTLLVKAYTDKSGDAAAEKSESQKNANAIRTYLVDEDRLDPKKVEAVGAGGATPPAAGPATGHPVRVDFEFREHH